MCEYGVPPFKYVALLHLLSAGIRLEEKSHFFTPSPISSRAREIFHKETNQQLPETAKNIRSGDRLWWATPPKIDWGMRNKVKAGSNPTIIQQYFHQHFNQKYNTHNVIYTDGSVCSDTTACGIVYQNQTSSIRLPRQCSIFTAEATAISIAVDECLSSTLPNVIITDSASVLSAMEKGQTKHPLIQTLDSIPSDLNVSFLWVPSHSGISGNDLADQAANQGRLTNPEPTSPVPGRDIKRWAKHTISNCWEQTWWNDSQPLLRRIKSTTEPWKDLPCPNEQRALTRLRIGHTRVTHDWILSRDPRPMCTFCGVHVTVEHLLLECRGYSNERQDCNLCNSISAVLSNNPTAEKNLLRFLRDTALIDKM